MNGVVLIDKPAGCTSHDVVNRWRKLAQTKRTGHLGTLDPMATGLLALLTGPATRLAQFLGRDRKIYDAEITFGMTSDTYDIEGHVSETGRTPCDEKTILLALDRFRGRFLQVPPPVSAKKVEGVRAYKLARKQVEVVLAPIEVEVISLEVLSIEPGKIALSIVCSAGTYIRSIAHDLGEQLGCGAVLSKLRRTQAGDFTIDRAHTIDQLTSLANTGRLCEAVIPAAHLLSHFPAEYFDSAAEMQIRQGRDFHTSPFVVKPGAPFVRALSRSGDLIAIGELKMPNLYHPGTVF